jgi:hypothetical protein
VIFVRPGAWRGPTEESRLSPFFRLAMLFPAMIAPPRLDLLFLKTEYQSIVAENDGRRMFWGLDCVGSKKEITI